MTAVTRPRGPLPARVYWTRRALLLVLPLVLVYAVAHLLAGGGSGGDSSARPVAVESSAAASSAAPTTPATAPVTPGTPVTPTPSVTGAATTPLPAPSGTCAGSDVVVTPAVEQPAYAGRAVVLTMTLTTATSPACTWTVSASSLVVKVTTSGDDRFWSTQDCVGSVEQQSVVVRRDTPVTVPVAWNGQRSDSDCSRSTPWAEPGTYDVVAAAYGNPTPGNAEFTLAAPPRPTVTATPTPDRDARVRAAQEARLKARADADRKAKLTPSATPRPSPSSRPSASPRSTAKPSAKPSSGH